LIADKTKMTKKHYVTILNIYRRAPPQMCFSGAITTIHYFLLFFLTCFPYRS
jgi:hypothetical protein